VRRASRDQHHRHLVSSCTTRVTRPLRMHPRIPNPSRGRPPGNHTAAPDAHRAPLARCDRTTANDGRHLCIGFASSSAHTRPRTCETGTVRPLVKVPATPARLPDKDHAPGQLSRGGAPHHPQGPQAPQAFRSFPKNYRTMRPPSPRAALCHPVTARFLRGKRDYNICPTPGARQPRRPVSRFSDPPVSRRLPGISPRAAGNITTRTYACQGRIAQSFRSRTPRPVRSLSGTPSTFL
jgi:hypothetical protein